MKIIFPKDIGTPETSTYGHKYITQFAFLNKTNKNEFTALTLPITCRDYLGDTLHGIRYNKRTYMGANVYTVPNKTVLNKDAVRLLLFAEKDSSDLDKTLENWDILNKIEEQNNLPKSTATKIIQENNTFLIIEGPPFWKDRVWAISLYSFIIRCLCHPKFGKTGIEASYFEKIKDNWNILINNLQQIANNNSSLSGWPKEESHSTHHTHGTYGFLALFSNYYLNDQSKVSNIYYQNFKKLLNKANKTERDTKYAAEPAIAF